MHPVTSLLLLPLAAQAADATGALQIESAPLPRCLEQIAAATGARFIVSPQLARSAPRCRRAAPAADAASALDAAFEPAVLRWRMRDDGVFLLAANTVQPAGTLDVLTVEGDAEGAGDPGEPAQAAVDAPRPAIADLATTTRYDADELAASPLARFNQVGRLAPNVYSSGQSLSIRGVPRDNDFFTGTGVWLDGIDVGTLLLDHNLIPVDALESLEYQRAASGFTDGAGHAGGAIRLATPDPSPQPGATLAASGGDRSAWSARASATGSLWDGGLSGRIALGRRDDPRYVRSVVVPELGGTVDERQDGSAKLLFEPEALPGFTLALNAFRIEGDAPDRSVARPGQGVPFDIFQGISHDRSAVDWDLAATGRGLRAVQALPGEGKLLAWGSSLDATREGVALRQAALTGRRRDDEDRTRFGLGWSQPFGGGWQLYAGLERQLLTRRDLEIRDTVAVLPGQTDSRETLTEELRLGNTALATELSWRNADWTVAAGLRRVDESVRFRFLERFEPAGRPVEDTLTESTRSGYTRNLPAFAVEYRLDDAHAVGANFNRAWRTGGFSEIRVIGEYPPERLDTGELFWRARWADDRVGTRLAVFRTDWRDRTGIDGTIGAEITEPWRTRIDGAELEFDAALSEAWTLRGGIGWLDARHVEGAYSLFFQSFDLAGERAKDAPRNTALLGLTWRGEGGWSAGIDAYHAGAAESATFVAEAVGEAVPLRRDAYTVVDARLGWAHGPWSVALVATNLFDEEYIDRFVERRAFSRIIGEPRQVELSVGWRF
jgi:hypothetical protein